MRKKWRAWKIIVAVIGAAVVIGSVSSCGDSTASALETESMSPLLSPDAKAPPEKSLMTQMEDFYHQRMLEYGTMSRDSAITLGKAVCEGLDAGLSFEQIGLIGFTEAPSLGAEGVGAAVGGAVVIWCPRHEAAMNRWVNE